MVNLSFREGWLLPSLLAIICWGMWGFLAKFGTQRVTWQMMMIYFGACTLAIGIIAQPTVFQFDKYHLIALLGGLACAMGFAFFYIALSRGQATVVIPLTSMYVAVAAILAFILLAEPLSVKKVLGIVSAILAVILLTG